MFFVAITDRQNLKNIEEVRRLNQAVVRALDSELRKFPPKVPVKGDVSVTTKLLNKRGALRYVNQRFKNLIYLISFFFHDVLILPFFHLQGN